jgi:hypothetical protein
LGANEASLNGIIIIEFTKEITNVLLFKNKFAFCVGKFLCKNDWHSKDDKNKIFNTNQAILFKGKSMQCFIMIYHIWVIHNFNLLMSDHFIVESGI